MRSILALAASALAGLATVISSLDGDADLVPFFVALTFAGGVAAWAVHPPYGGLRRRLAVLIAWAWSIAGVWVGVLLAWFQAWSSSSGPTPGPEATYLGLTATIYHLVGLYGGLLLVTGAVFGSEGVMERGGPDPEPEVVRP